MNETLSRNGTILQVEDLKKYFPIRRGFFQRIASWVRAVENVSFVIKGGKTLGLVGESGCGKTTVARLILKVTFSTARTQLATRWKNPLRMGKYFFRSST